MTPLQQYKKINRLKQILELEIPLDPTLTMIFQTPVIDIIALDKKLIKYFKYKGSMKDFIKAKFGDEAVLILEKNIEQSLYKSK